jgi:hypothetical protein
VLRRERLITVATFATGLEASLARGALEAAGIRAVIHDEGLGTFSRWRGGLRGDQLQVFASDHDRAVVALRRMNIQIVQPSGSDVGQRNHSSSGGREWVMTVKVLLAMLLAFLVLGLIFDARSRAGQLPFSPQRPAAGR